MDTPITGPEAITAALGRIDLAKLEEDQRAIIRARKVSKRPAAVKTLNIIEGLRRNKLQPSDLLIQHVPVIPAAFRPFSVLGNSFVPGDANELYRDLIKMRDAHGELEGVLGPEGAGDSRLDLYDSVKALYGFGDPVVPKTLQRGVSGFLKQITGANPKFSYVQRKLLSKPQDSVSRGTIAVDPELSLDEIGVPEDMAWKMYAPYVQRRLTTTAGMGSTDALKHVRDRTPFAERALFNEMQVRPTIYSRAPSWHKFNVLAAHPKLIKGHTIAINPLVTTGLNADFDGDAMNLHVPSGDEAVKEAYEKLLPSKMLFSIRDQDKVVPLPKHEQILGLFTAHSRPAQTIHRFNSHAEAMDAIQKGRVPLSDEIEFPGMDQLSKPAV